MSHPKDIDEHQPDPAELMLVELLYGELEGNAREQAMERVQEDELGDELDGLQALRAMFRELPDEEPPAAVSAKLLHAAAVQGPAAAKASSRSEGQEKQGILAWLGSLIRPISMYPGLAAATTLVLVVGVAGTLYLSGRNQIAKPHVSSQSATVPEPVATERAPATEPAAEGGESATGTLERDIGDGEWRGAEQQAPADTTVAAPAESRKGEEERAKESAPRPSKPVSIEGKLSKKRRPSKNARKADRKASYYEGGDLGQVLDESKSSASGAGKRSYSKAPAAATRAPQGRAAPAKDSMEMDDDAPAAAMDEDSAGAAAEAPQQAEKSADKANESARIRSLHQEARSAAQNEQCEVVRKIASMIRARDASYYKNTYLRDKSLATCLGKLAR